MSYLNAYIITGHYMYVRIYVLYDPVYTRGRVGLLDRLIFCTV